MLEQTIQRRLLQDPDLSAFDIKVEVLHDIVTLRGQVPTARAKLAAHELASAIPGCSTLINELAVVPAGGVSDDDVAAEIRELLDHHPEVTKEAITIQVEGGLVTLSGAVATPQEYGMAEDLVRSARGVRGVQNMLIIDRDAQYDDESLQLEIQAALAEADALHGAEIKVAVSGDLILLAGQVSTPHQKDLAAEIARGVRPWRIRNDIAVVAKAR